MAAKQHVRATMADVLRARGKLGPYKEETPVPKTTRYGGASNEFEPVVSAAEPETTEAEDLEPIEAPAVQENAAESVAVDEDSSVPPGEPYDTWLLAELRDECSARELPTSGNKPDLIARLVAYDEVQV